MSAFPPALPHGSFTEVLPGFHVVTGQMKINALMAFDRNMTVVEHPDGLVIFNSLRLDDEGLKELDQLGKVTDVVRVGAHHGRDDAFYVDRYKATMWAPQGCSKKLDPTCLDASAKLPIEGAQVFLIGGTKKPETLIRLPQHGGVVLPCDALQNWIKPHPEYATLASKLFMKPMGFFSPAAVGVGWRMAEKPSGAEFHRFLKEWDFENLLPAHGDPILGGAKAAYKTTIEKLYPT